MPKLNLNKKIVFIKLIICFISVLGFINICSAQQKKADSIKIEINNLKNNKSFSEKDTTYISLINKLAGRLRFYNLDSVLSLSKEALKISSSIKYEKGESVALSNIANYYLEKGDYDNSIIYSKKALTIANENKLFKTSAFIYNLLGAIYIGLDDYSKGLNSFLKGLKLAKKQNNNRWLSIYNENIANLYANQKDYEHAMYFYNEAMLLNKEIGNDKKTAKTMSNVALNYAETKNYDEALEYINKSIKTLKKYHIYEWLAHAYKVKGYVYLKQKKYKWAINWFEESLLIHKKIKDDLEKVKLHNYFAQAYLGLKKDIISKKHAMEAYEIAKKINNSKQLQKASKTLYQINKKENNISEALRYNEIYQEFFELRTKNSNTRILSMYRAKVEYEEQEKKLIQQNKNELKKKQNYIYAALGISLISIFVIVSVFRSRREQEKLNRKLNKQKVVLLNREAELKDSNNTKNMLFSIIGHDLRGPIGALESLLDLFKKGDIEDADFLKMVPKLQKDVNHISFTLNNLLSWSQTQMEGVNTKPIKFVFNDLVKENINLLSESAKKKSITINNNLQSDIQIWSDRNQIDIVIRNLLSNALKFTSKKGTITIKSQEKENNWVISMEDTGIGMDKYTQEKIFKKETNITTFGTNNEKGTGIGLSLCKEMINKNNGTIWVESTLNRGSVFYFTLPKKALNEVV